MNLLSSKVRPMYFRYLGAAFGSAMIASIYGVVDMAMVGHYHGPEGSAAMAVIAPVWNVLYSLGLLMGIGGSVLFSNLRGQSEKNADRANQVFTSALLGTCVIAALSWLVVIFFDDGLLRLFGASDALMPIAKRYIFPIKFGVPVFLFTQLFSAFLRNDSDPGLATKAVMGGGVFNVFGDYFFVFIMDMGSMGAGIATVMGATASLLIMLLHFRKKENTIRFSRPEALPREIAKIMATGFSTFFIDIAMGILTILFNRQILRFLDADALSVYGIIINISTFVQCCAYSVGQAAQPIISANYGAGNGGRVKETLRYATATALLFGVTWTAVCWIAPNGFVKIFMTATENVLTIAPGIIRRYSLSFLLLPVNIFSTYYFQSLMKPQVAFAISVMRGAVISGILILVLPLALGGSAVWFAMPITELLTAAFVFRSEARCSREL